MKRPTIAELQSEVERLQPYALALYLMHSQERPDARQSYTYDGSRCTWTLYGATRCDGGTLVQVIRTPKQTPSVSAYNFDAMRARVRDSMGASEVCNLNYNAIEALARVRSQLLESAS